MSDFSFDGISSTSLHVKLLKSEISLLPATRDKLLTLSGKHGALRMVPDFGERSLQLNCWLQANSLTQLHSRLDAIRQWLNPLKGHKRLIFDTASDRYYLATYAGAGLDSEIVARQGLFMIDFICPDPFAYSVTPQTVSITMSPHVHTQQGTMSANPLLRLQGSSALGQSISIVIGDITATYQGVLAPTDWLEIDCDAKTVTRVVGAVRTNVLKHMVSPNFPVLAIGTNNITISAAGGASWSLLEMHCRNRWL